LSFRHAADREGKSHIRRHDLLVPRLTGKLPIAEQGPPNLAIRTITADDILGLKPILFARGRLDIDPGFAIILSESGHIVIPRHRGSRFSRDVIHQNLPQPVQRQTHHPVRVVLQNLLVEAGDVRAVEFPPADAVGMEALSPEILYHAGATEFVHCWRSIVGGSRLLVKFAGLVDDLDWDALPGEHEAE
jgi:hypothetical protein